MKKLVAVVMVLFSIQSFALVVGPPTPAISITEARELGITIQVVDGSPPHYEPAVIWVELEFSNFRVCQIERAEFGNSSFSVPLPYEQESFEIRIRKAFLDSYKIWVNFLERSTKGTAGYHIELGELEMTYTRRSSIKYELLPGVIII